MSRISDHSTIISRIVALRRKYAGDRGKALFAKELGISPSTYSYYERDRVPPADIIYRICELTGADINWLLTGQASEAKGVDITVVPDALSQKIESLLEKNPQSLGAMLAFVELLSQKTDVEKSIDSGQKHSDKPSWLPVLGRTAAGMVHFWAQSQEQLPQVTELAELIDRHCDKRHSQLQRQQIDSDSLTANLPPLKDSHIHLVGLNEPDEDGLCEFIEAPDVLRRYPDAFALRVDGDSMAPRIGDGDIVVLSPSVLARDGMTAVVQIKGQIGVTCKIFRREETTIHLIPANENYPHKTFPQHDLQWALAVLWRIRLK